MAFAPGKVILLGEHAVVYGHPALAGALSHGVTVENHESGKNTSGKLSIPEWALTVTPNDDSPVGKAFAAIAARLGVSPDRELVVRFGLPTSAGLGSSAALSVALARALAPTAAEDAILDAAMAAETIFHGKPSGIDAAISARGGLGRFTRAGGLVAIPAARRVPLVVGHTGQQRDTRGRVARVAELVTEREGEMRERFAAIANLVERGVRAIAEGNLGELGACMDENARHLAAMEVGTQTIERMCGLAREAGAVGCKLTGGGGGGCVIALAPGREDAVRAVWTSAGFHNFSTEVGA